MTDKITEEEFEAYQKYLSKNNAGSLIIHNEDKQMKEEEAIIILNYYNQWRQGKDIPMLEPSVITEAIKTIIDYYYKNTNK